jgi:hypothetical protein
VLHVGAAVQCIHAGIAQPTAFNPRVTVSGQAIVTMVNAYAIAGCAFPAMVTGAPPCATAQWVTSATRVTSLGQPVLLQDSQATCIPNGTSLLIMTTQFRSSGM